MKDVKLRDLTHDEMRKIEGGSLLGALIAIAVGFVIGFICERDQEAVR